MGRSGSELTTKIHALVDAEGRPVRLELTARQAGDIPPGLSPFGMIRRIIPSSATTTAKSCAACRAISVPTMVRSSSPRAVRQWIAPVGARTAFIEPSSPWDGGGSENSPGDCFPDDGHLRELQLEAPLRDALLNGQLFYSLAEARIVIKSWCQHYNILRPHSSLGYMPPAPAAMSWPAAPPSTMAAKPSMHWI